MKKSKIIVPAVALLALGMAASVTGTVAWFSVNNSVKSSSISSGTIDEAAGSLLQINGLNVNYKTATYTGGGENSDTLTFTDSHTLTDVTSADSIVFNKYKSEDIDKTTSKPKSEVDPLVVSSNPVFNQDETNVTRDNRFTAALAGSRAFIRYGFYVENISGVDLKVSTTGGAIVDQTSACRITVAAGEFATGSAAAAIVSPDATGLSGSSTIYAAAQTSAVDGHGAASAFSNSVWMPGATNDVVVLEKDHALAYVVTIWLEGWDADVVSGSFTSGAFSVNGITFSAVANV